MASHLLNSISISTQSKQPLSSFTRSLPLILLPPKARRGHPPMQGLPSYSNDVVRLDLSPTPTTTRTISPSSSSLSSLSIDVEESAETRIRRLIAEHPVILFSRASCCMCHAMKNLLATLGVHPTVIELDDHEIAALSAVQDESLDRTPLRNRAPAVFIGGTCVGGLESLVALHLGGHLVPKLVEVGALWV